MRPTTTDFLALALFVAVLSGGFLLGNQAAAQKGDTRVFEMRTYVAHPGRLDALNARFRNHTVRLFAKHGMTNVGYWVPAEQKDGEPKLIYIVAHKSREAANASWKAFREDPEWTTARKASEEDGPIVAKIESVYLTPTDYSALR